MVTILSEYDPAAVFDVEGELAELVVNAVKSGDTELIKAAIDIVNQAKGLATTISARNSTC